MKKSICTLLALCLILSGLSGCGGAAVPTEPATEPTAESTAPSETVSPFPEEILETLRQNLPVMDGSTSLIPLEAGIRAALYGKTLEEATADVRHSSTWSAFYNLLEGYADLIFSVPLSEEQERYAAECGVTLEAVPIALEGFVFVVNAENPVDTLTQQQLRDIYSGRITNWSQVGGLDEEIIPYQRNTDSGSQNYMTEFMGDTPLMDAPTEMRPASMSGLMDVIAVNDNSRAAIGYSVYAYAADMYGNGNEIKFIRVDGVAPSKASFADGTYPLMGSNYAIFRADEPEDSPVRQMVAWMCSFEGQTAIAQAGYVTVMDVGFDYAEAVLTKYQGTGTGAAAGEVPTSEYVLVGTAYDSTGGGYDVGTLTPAIAETDGMFTYRITQLADKELQSEINAWIDEQMVWVHAQRPELEKLLEELNGDDEYALYVYGLQWSNSQPEGMDAACIVTAKNGCLSVAVSLCYTEQTMEGTPRYYRTETAVWDLLSGQRLEPEALFCQGVDVAQTLNAHLRVCSQQGEDYFGTIPDMKQDFAALPESGWHLTHDTIYFDYGSPFFVHGEAFSLDGLPDGVLVTEQLRPFSECFDPAGDARAVRQFRISGRDIYYEYNADQLVYCGLLAADASPYAEQINGEMMDYLDTHFTGEAIRGYFQALGYDTTNLDLWMMDFQTTNLGGRYLLFNGYAPELYVEETNSFVPYPYPDHILYDLQTGRQISWREMLTGNWEEAVIWENSQAPNAELNAQEEWFYVYNGDSLRICFSEDGEYYYAIISAEYFQY